MTIYSLHAPGVAGKPPHLAFSVWESPQRTRKRLTFDGVRLTPESAVQPYSGSVYRRQIEPRHIDLGAVLDGLETQAISIGVPHNNLPSASFVTVDARDHGNPNEVARCKAEVVCPDSAYSLIFVDVDHRKEWALATRSDAWKLLLLALPELDRVKTSWRWSSSSMIADLNGNIIQRARGVHGWIIGPTSEVEAITELIYTRFAAAGLVIGFVTDDGRVDVRYPTDRSVHAWSRLVFVAEPECSGCKAVDRDGSLILGAGPDVLRLALLRPLEPGERALAKRNVEQAKASVAVEARNRRAIYAESHVRKVRAKNPAMSETRARAQVRAMLEGGKLTSDHEIEVVVPGGIEVVTVEQIYADRTRYHRRTCRDPVEPTYQNGKVTGIIYTDRSVVTISSQAHGGRNFQLQAPRRGAR